MTDGKDVEVVDLAALSAHEVGALWAFGGEQLNATLLSWEPGHEIEAHVNSEREVLLVVVRGDGTLSIDEVEHELRPGCAIVIPRGAGRAIHAGPGGLAYVTAHQARGPLQVTRRRAPRVPPA
jgi:quercetin dioxygenase-like cupin family protein